MQNRSGCSCGSGLGLGMGMGMEGLWFRQELQNETMNICIAILVLIAVTPLINAQVKHSQKCISHNETERGKAGPLTHTHTQPLN